MAKFCLNFVDFLAQKQLKVITYRIDGQPIALKELTSTTKDPKCC